MASVRVIQEVQISPSPSLPPQPPQPLSFLDAMWLQSSLPVERLFFYDFPHPTSHFIDHNLPILTNSLSLTLRHFYPLAGSIRPSPNSDEQFEITYVEDDSVTITIVEFIGDEFRNISGHHSKSFKNLRLLVPKLAKTSLGGQFPVFSIQITIFPNQGLCIGFAIHHAACDGFGSMQFIWSWAAACHSAEPMLDDISLPFLDRSVIIDTCGIRWKIFEMMCEYKGVSGKCLEKQSSLSVSDPDLVFATFTLNKDQIGLLKERVQAKSVEEGKPSLHISAFVVTCAYVWRCLVKAQAYNYGDIKQYFVCAVDWRARMRPSIPSNYFGNCLGACMAEVNTRELVEKNGNEVAAIEISKSIDGLQGKDVCEALKAVIDRHWEPTRSRRLSVAGSPKFRVYEVDFGWGRSVKVDVTSIAGTRAMSLVESREEEGGMEIGLVLSEEEMNMFGTNFATGLLHIF